MAVVVRTERTGRVLVAHEDSLSWGYGAEIVAEIHQNGSRLPIQCQSTLIRDENGDPDYVCGVARDMTERRAYEEQLRKRKGR